MQYYRVTTLYMTSSNSTYGPGNQETTEMCLHDNTDCGYHHAADEATALARSSPLPQVHPITKERRRIGMCAFRCADQCRLCLLGLKVITCVIASRLNPPAPKPLPWLEILVSMSVSLAASPPRGIYVINEGVCPPKERYTDIHNRIIPNSPQTPTETI